MGQVQVYNVCGRIESYTCRSVVCPKCGTKMVPRYLSVYGKCFFCECSEDKCCSLFLIQRRAEVDEVIPNHAFKGQTFSDTICAISSNFPKIYNEALSAEQMGLKEICGVGYRKALEFLIKDYVMRGKKEEEQEKIKKMQLVDCIAKYVDNENVKAVARRATWLGNDETHYVRKWGEKDVSDLKNLILLTLWWIEQTVKTEELLCDMPEGR